MRRVHIHSHVRHVDKCPAANNDRRDVVGVAGESTTDTQEQGLTLAVRLVDQSTGGAGTTRIPGINRDNHYPCAGRLVGDLLGQVVKRPRVQLSPVRFPNSYPFEDTFEFFKGQASSGVFSAGNYSFGDHVVRVFGEALLLPTTLDQQSFSSIRAFAFKAVPNASVPAAQAVHMGTAKDVAIAGSNYVDDSHIQPKEVWHFANGRHFDFAGLVQVPLAVSQQQVSLAGQRLEQSQLPLSCLEGYALPSFQRPDRNALIDETPGQDAFVISDAAEAVKVPLRLAIQLVGVGHFGDQPNGHLRRHAEPLPHRFIGEMVQVILAKGLRLPRLFADVIGRVIGGQHRAVQRIGLFWRWTQVDLRDQLHIASIAEASRLERTRFLPWLKPGVSARLIR